MSLAVPLTDKEYAECFNAFKMLSTEWTAMRQWLAQEFLPLMAGRESAKVMSIGSGTGDFDLVLIRLLSKEIPSISYTALDPNQEHNRIFSERYGVSGLDLDSFRIIPRPFGEVDLPESFDLIHMTHCLYYIPDRKEAILQAYNLPNPGGFLLIFHQTSMGINEIQRKYMKRVKNDEKEMFSAHDILRIFSELGLKFNFDILISDIDVTDCIAGNENGQKILNFFLESRLEGLDRTLQEEIIQTLKSICRVEGGRYFLFHPCGIFWIRRMVS
ncbi:MAG: class I SAM-dependent methyltransferase [Methanothrix sp.]|nr:class I SAM-dependent methyltransferase [Methanothrix sp.]